MVIDKATAVAFSGYRLARISKLTNRSMCEILLRDVISELYGQGYRYFISGMATGFDLWAAAQVACMRDAGLTDIALVAAIPCPQQTATFDLDSAELYNKVLRSSNYSVILSDKISKQCYLKRNDWMLHNASTLVCFYDGNKIGGTAYTVSRARRMGMPIINLADIIEDQSSR